MTTEELLDIWRPRVRFAIDTIYDGYDGDGRNRLRWYWLFCNDDCTKTNTIQTTPLESPQLQHSPPPAEMMDGICKHLLCHISDSDLESEGMGVGEMSRDDYTEQAVHSLVDLADQYLEESK